MTILTVLVDDIEYEVDFIYHKELPATKDDPGDNAEIEIISIKTTVDCFEYLSDDEITKIEDKIFEKAKELGK